MTPILLPVGLILVLLGIAGYLLVSMISSIRNEMRRSGVRKIWKNFDLSIGFAILFFTSWIAQVFAEWHVYLQDQRAHGEGPDIPDFIVHFSQSTLENWQQSSSSSIRWW